MRIGILGALVAGVALFAGGYVSGRFGDVSGGPAAAAPANSKPAYMIVTGDVTDRAAFVQGYAAKLPTLYDRFGGRYLAIGGDPVLLEGEREFASFVVGEWPSVEAALAFWNSDEYDALRRARIDGEWGAFEVFLVEGLARPTRVSPLLNTGEDD